MSTVETACGVVLPLLLLMGLGVLIRRVGLVDEQGFVTINRVVFYVGIPCVVFQSIVGADYAHYFDLRLALWIGIGLPVAAGVACLVAVLIDRDPKRRGVLAQGMFRGNDAVFALAVAAAVMDENALGVMSFGVAISIPVMNVISVLLLTLFCGGRLRFGKLLLSLVKNPIILAVAAAFLWRATGWTLPALLAGPVSKLAAMTSPLAFLVLGGTLTLRSAIKDRGVLSLAVAFKLILLPTIMCLAAYYLGGFRSSALLTIFLLFAAPTAMSSYPLASALGGDASLAAEIVAFTTALSLATLFLFLSIFGGVLLA